jgi:2-methylcitrate dehydratase PrpD
MNGARWLRELYKSILVLPRVSWQDKEMVMVTTQQALTKFIVETGYEDLPPEVIHETKRILLDSIGCALSGTTSEKGKIATRFAKRSESRKESTLIGFGDRVSCSDAAFANGEYICALDFDDITHPQHVTPFVLPAPFAIAEAYNASGKDLILAVAIAHEVAARLGIAISNFFELMHNDSLVPIQGYSSCVFGGTAGCVKIMKLNAEKVSHALGIAGYAAPVQATMRFGFSIPAGMTKHLPAGWINQDEINAALMADMGFLGDVSVFDGDRGFWRYAGSQRWEPQKVVKKLGREWIFPGVMIYKPYPSCRALHTGLDCLYNLMDKHNIKCDEIEQINVWGGPEATIPTFTNRKIANQVDSQFSIPYMFSVAAHRIRIGPEWQDMETLRDPQIVKFMDKIIPRVNPGFKKAFDKNPDTELTKVEIIARGKSFTEERENARGRQYKAELKISDDELTEKFKRNASRLLPSHKIDRVPEQIFKLETLDRMSIMVENIVI